MLRTFFRTSVFPARPVKSLAFAVLLLFILSAGAHAEPRSEWVPNQQLKESKWRKMWKWSATALMAGNAMDVASSYGYQEANGFLRSGNGQLNQRGVAIKFGVMAGALAGQYYLLKKNPEMQKPLAITNFAVGAAYGGIAVRNWKVR